MNWVIELTMQDGRTEPMYCVSRQEARERARFYRTMCEDGPGKVIRTRVRKVGEEGNAP